MILSTALLPDALGRTDMKAKTALLTRLFAQAQSLRFGAMLLNEQMASTTEREALSIDGQRRFADHRRRTLCPGPRGASGLSARLDPLDNK
ncbi:MAG: hypothetical protein ACLFQC_06780 [Wenzhouxiangella sp.]